MHSTDATYARIFDICLPVCVLVTRVSPAKTDEPIEMPLGGQTRMDQQNHVADRDAYRPTGGGVKKSKLLYCDRYFRG